MATEGFLDNIEETGRVWLRIDMKRTHYAKQCLNRRSAGVSCCSTHSVYRTITARPPEAARASSLRAGRGASFALSCTTRKKITSRSHPMPCGRQWVFVVQWNGAATRTPCRALALRQALGHDRGVSTEIAFANRKIDRILNCNVLRCIPCAAFHRPRITAGRLVPPLGSRTLSSHLQL